jgi:hypothetical protein
MLYLYMPGPFFCSDDADPIDTFQSELRIGLGYFGRSAHL